MFKARAVRVILGSALLSAVLPFALSTGAASGAGGAKLSGTPLLIGSIMQETSSTTATRATEGEDALNAWVKWTNTHGGINGHPVKVFILDDKGDPAVGFSEAKTLVETDHVIAIVGQQAAVSDATWAPYVVQQRMPVIGGQQTQGLFFTNPMFYPVGGDVVANIWGQMKSAAVQGVKKVGVVLCTESPACAQAQAIFKADAQSVGMDPVYNTLASATQPSYTAECLAAKQSGATAVAAFVNDVVLSRDCARQNFKPKWINADEGPTIATILAAPALGNAVGSSEHWNCRGPQTSQTKAYNLAMAKYAPQWLKGGSKYATGGIVDCSVWDAAMGFRKAILNSNVAPSATATNEDVIKGLAKFQGETLGGFSPPMTYSDGSKPNPRAKCTYLYKYKGTTLIPVPGTTKYTCQP
jgi:branched-chain amino acid transport system substrate-binding protein